MSFLKSIFGQSAAAVNPVQALGKQVQVKFNESVEHSRYGKTITLEEIKELAPVLYAFNNMKAMDQPARSLQEQIDATNFMFTAAFKSIQPSLTSNPVIRAQTTLEYKAKFEVLKKLESFVCENHQLISEVQSLSQKNPKDFEKAIEGLKKQAGVEVAAAIARFVELDMKGIRKANVDTVSLGNKEEEDVGLPSSNSIELKETAKPSAPALTSVAHTIN